MSVTGAIAYTADRALAFWPTPPEVAHDAVWLALMPWHCTGEGVRVLEPSAGDGHLAAEIRAQLPDAHITCVEPQRDRAEKLRSLNGVANEVVGTSIEDYLTTVAFSALRGAWEPFDLVIMNPPFALDDRPEAWAEHILALYDDPYLLAPGGLISAVVPRIVMTGQSKLVRRVRQLTLPHPYGITECERGAFGPVGAQVSTALIQIERSGGAE